MADSKGHWKHHKTVVKVKSYSLGM